MAYERLQDRYFNTIGYTELMPDGWMKLLDKDYNTLGYYDPQLQRTMDKNYNTVGHGNILMTLLR